MIEKYKIKNINGEEILYVYLSFDYEFSKIDFFDNIKDYFKNFKIKFNGKKIVLVTAGIVFATLTLNNPTSFNKNNYDYNYVSSIIIKNHDENLNETGELVYDIKKLKKIKKRMKQLPQVLIQK